MSIKITKQLVITDDIDWGLGQVTQQRNVNGTGPEEVVYDQINASKVPTTSPIGNVQEDLNNIYTKAETDGKYTTADQVLTKTNSIIYEPSNLYHPATKKYVDDTVLAIGAGDMNKAIYDVGDTGSVDNAHSLGGLNAAKYQAERGALTDTLDNAVAVGYYSGTDVPDAPISGAVILEVFTEGTLTVQKMYSPAVQGYYFRMYSAGAWINWDRMLPDSEITPGIMPVGSIIMFAGDLSAIATNWKICDGNNGTPDLVDKFIMGGADQSSIGTEGGTLAATMPAHTHTANHSHTGSSASNGNHSHTANHNHSASSNSTGAHVHGGSVGTTLGVDPNVGYMAGWTAGNTGSAGAHSHTITVNTTNFSTSTTGSHTHTITVNTASVTTGSASASGDNRPPYYTLAYIQRTA